MKRFKINISKQKIIITTVSLILLIGIILLPEIFVRLQAKPKIIKANIENLSKKYNLTFSYDGLTLGFYGGIQLYQFELSLNRDLSRKKVLLKVNNLSVGINWWRFIKSNEVELKSLSADSAQWNLNFSTRNQARLLAKVNLILAITKKLSIYFPKNQMNVRFLKGGYKKINWKLKNIKLQLKSSTAKESNLESKLTYNNKSFGEGSIKIIGKNPPYSSSNVRIIYDLKNFPMKKATWWFSNLKAKTGKLNISGKYQMMKSRKGKRYQNYSGKLTLKNANLIYNKLNLVQINDKFKYEYQRGRKTHSGNLKGKLQGFNFDLSWYTHQKSSWFNQFKIKLSNEKSDLPFKAFNSTIIGLQTFYLQFKKGKNSSTYRNINANIKLKNAKLSLFKRKLNFQIPSLHLKIKNNKYNLSSNFKIGKTSANISSSGSLQSRKIKFKPLIDQFETYFKSGRRITIPVFFGRGKGSIQIKDLYFNDLNNLILQVVDLAKEKITNEKKLYLIKSRLLNRFFYVTFMQRGYFEHTINIKNWHMQQETLTDTYGDLELSYSNLKFNLVNSRMNAIKSIWYYSLLESRINTQLKLQLKRDTDLINWFSPLYLKDFKSLTLNTLIQSKGERLSDLYRSSYIKSYYYINKPVVGTIFENKSNANIILAPNKQKINSNWSKISFSLTQKGSKGQVAKLRGYKKKLKLKGYASFKEKNFSKKWRLKIKQTK